MRSCAEEEEEETITREQDERREIMALEMRDGEKKK